MNVSESDIKNILERYRKFTVYGLSPDPAKPSHSVPMFMRNEGYGVAGIYPGVTDILGVPVYPSLKEVPPEFRKFVDVFRKSDAIPGVVDEVLKVGGVEVMWLQLGITHPEAEKRAEAAGLRVVSNRCLYIEYKKWRPALPKR